MNTPRIPHRASLLSAAALALCLTASGVGQAAEPITVESLIKAGVVARRRDGVKILGVGEWTTTATFEVEAASKSAVAAIEKAGGSVKTLREEATQAVS